MSNFSFLALNRQIVNLIVLSDSSGFGGGFIKDECEHSIIHHGGNTNDFVDPVIRDIDPDSSSLAKHMADFGLVKTHRDDPGTSHFINSFKS